MIQQKRIPPARTCEDCGETFRAWGGVLCPACVRLLQEDDTESLRAYRKRVIDPQRNSTEGGN